MMSLLSRVMEARQQQAALRTGQQRLWTFVPEPASEPAPETESEPSAPEPEPEPEPIRSPAPTFSPGQGPPLESTDPEEVRQEALNRAAGAHRVILREVPGEATGVLSDATRYARQRALDLALSGQHEALVLGIPGAPSGRLTALAERRRLLAAGKISEEDLKRPLEPGRRVLGPPPPNRVIP